MVKMSEFALLIDFGSTYTKLRAIQLDEVNLMGSSQGPSTVATDINIGMNLALKNLESKIGKLPNFKYRLASSSAAGGLKMVRFSNGKKTQNGFYNFAKFYNKTV